MTNEISLSDRMKEYEKAYKFVLPYRLPLILRLDGKNFSSFTKNFEKPFDNIIVNCMNKTAIELCEQLQGACFAYVQSDEISILIHSYKKFNSQPLFTNQLQKIVSISAGIASSSFQSNIYGGYHTGLSVFDCRAFVVPENDVCNYFLNRQNDSTRNSIQMLARSLYSHKECDKKNGKELQDMCLKKNKNWNDLAMSLKRGRCIVYDERPEFRMWRIDNEIPIFSQNRDYINRHLECLEN